MLAESSLKSRINPARENFSCEGGKMADEWIIRKNWGVISVFIAAILTLKDKYDCLNNLKPLYPDIDCGSSLPFFFGTFTGALFVVGGLFCVMFTIDDWLAKRKKEVEEEKKIGKAGIATYKGWGTKIWILVVLFGIFFSIATDSPLPLILSIIVGGVIYFVIINRFRKKK